MNNWLYALVISLVSASVFLPVTVTLLRKNQIIDIPNHRSSHSRATVRGAGVALGLAAILTLVVTDAPVSSLVAVACFTGLGLADDLRSLPAKARLSIQFAVAVVVAGTYVYSDDVVQKDSLLIVGTCVVTLLFFVNAVNFMDGINGITLIHGVILGGAYSLICFNSGLDSWGILGTTLVGLSVAFLPWNLGNTAQVFLGDSGSYLYGAIVGILVAVVLLQGPGFLVAIGPILIYAVDVIGTIATRSIKRENIFEAHRDHIFQQLVTSGWTHNKSAGLVGLFSFFGSGIAVLLANHSISNVTAVIGYVVLAIAYLSFAKKSTTAK